jgi:hypothetical protein
MRKFNIKRPTWLGSGDSPEDIDFSCLLACGERVRKLSKISFIKVVIPLVRLHHHDFHYFQGPHLL